jgi:hypothetical protein
MIDTYREYSHYEKLERTNFNSFGSNNATELTEEEFIDMLKLDGWITGSIDPELEKLSKEEILEYFRISGFKK